tara:strand:- start:1414 stop:1617 length:204 start_codon:yes stop_codon:yes gene_type:complete
MSKFLKMITKIGISALVNKIEKDKAKYAKIMASKFDIPYLKESDEILLCESILELLNKLPEIVDEKA